MLVLPQAQPEGRGPRGQEAAAVSEMLRDQRILQKQDADLHVIGAFAARPTSANRFHCAGPGRPSRTTWRRNDRLAAAAARRRGSTRMSLLKSCAMVVRPETSFSAGRAACVPTSILRPGRGPADDLGGLI